MLGDEVAEVDHRHRSLETRVEGGAGKFGGSHPGDFFDDGETGIPEIGEDIGDRSGVVIGFVGFAVLEIGGVKRFSAAGVIAEALVP